MSCNIIMRCLNLFLLFIMLSNFSFAGIDDLLPYVIPADKKQNIDIIKEEIKQNYTEDQINRMVKFAPIFGHAGGGEHSRYVDFYGKIVSCLDKEYDDIFKEKLSLETAKEKDLDRKIELAGKLVGTFVDNMYAENDTVFYTESGVKIIYKSDYNTQNLPEPFLNDLDKQEKLFLAATGTSSTFLIYNGYNEVIGYRSFRGNFESVNSIFFTMAKKYRGQGIGKNANLAMLKIWANDPVLGRKKTIKITGSSDAGRGLIGSLKKAGLQPIEESIDMLGNLIVKFSMENVKKLNLKS